jgi:hypothetical protein
MVYLKSRISTKYLKVESKIYSINKNHGAKGEKTKQKERQKENDVNITICRQY